MLRTRCRVPKSALDRFRRSPALLFVAVALLSGAPAFADLTGVSVSGSADGSGSLTFICPTFPSCNNVSGPSFSFSGTNSSLGTFSVSGSTSGVDPFGFLTDKISGGAQQVTTATADSLSINLMENASSSVEEFFVDIHGRWQTSISNSVTLSFDLTTTSVLQLSSCGIPVLLFCQLRDSDGTVILTLPSSATTDVLLSAGMYNLFYVSSFDVGDLPGVSFFPEDSTLSAEIVPEPSQAAYLPLLMLLFVLGLRAWFSRLRITPAIQ